MFAFSLDNAHSARSSRRCSIAPASRFVPDIIAPSRCTHGFGRRQHCRASFGMYTTHEEVDYLAEALTAAREFFA